MVQIARQLSEFRTSERLPPLALLLLLLDSVAVKVLLEFFILLAKVLQLFLTLVEVVLVFPHPIPTYPSEVPLVHLLDERGLLRKEVVATPGKLLLLADCEPLCCVVGPEGRLDAYGGCIALLLPAFMRRNSLRFMYILNLDWILRAARLSRPQYFSVWLLLK